MTDKKKKQKSIKPDISEGEKRNIRASTDISVKTKAMLSSVPVSANVDATFYATAVLHLCGSMDIQSGIRNFYEFLKEHIPVTGITLGRTYIESSTTDIIAVCTDEGIIASNLRIYHPGITDLEVFSIDKETDYIEDSDFPLIASICEATPGANIPQPPCFFIRIRNEGLFFGGVFFFCDKDNPFTEEQITLLQLLQRPLSFVLSNSLQCMELSEYNENLLKDNLKLKKELLRQSEGSFIGKDTGLAHIYDRILKVAPIDINILITGETGVGKDIVAHTIYKESARKDKPYIIVNCAAIAPSLIDSELFGHMKGSFTGAIQDHKGFFEQADTGTLFLDEIGELPLESQSRLLRTLQDGSIRPVGSTKEIKVNFRLISATNQNLERKIQQGLFREDLYFRLCELPIEVPPLRQRKQDIPLFVRHFISVYSSVFNMPEMEVSEQEMYKLMQYAWPGNVRELQNSIKSTLATTKSSNLVFQLTDSTLIEVDSETQEETLSFNYNPVLKKDPSNTSIISYEDFKRLYFSHLLKHTKGKIRGKGGAAFFAQLHPSTLSSKLDKLGVEHGKNQKQSKNQ